MGLLGIVNSMLQRQMWLWESEREEGQIKASIVQKKGHHIKCIYRRGTKMEKQNKFVTLCHGWPQDASCEHSRLAQQEQSNSAFSDH